ncbi:four helix bundle protein [Patescibacteria group bacterium]|nr:four helix bundle protein [Patescibacteria group bacterium]MBU1705557.1 four helix bundle protein [Patescibacteria group bacterium]
MPLLHKIKDVYLDWFSYYSTLPKCHRYTLGSRVDGLLIEIIEAAALAGFTPRAEKLPFIRLSIRKLDTAKVLLMVLWETKSLDNKKYIALSEKLEEIGRMLGGWHGQVAKSGGAGFGSARQTSSETRPEER